MSCWRTINRYLCCKEESSATEYHAEIDYIPAKKPLLSGEEENRLSEEDAKKTLEKIIEEHKASSSSSNVMDPSINSNNNISPASTNSQGQQEDSRPTNGSGGGGTGQDGGGGGRLKTFTIAMGAGVKGAMKQMMKEKRPPPPGAMLQHPKTPPCFYICSYSESTAVQAFASNLLSQATADIDEESMPPIVDNQILTGCNALLHSSDTNTLCQTLTALKILVKHEVNKKNMIQAGNLQAIIPLARSENMKIRKVALGVIRLLSMTDEHKPLIGRSEALQALLLNLKAPTPTDITLDALATLAELSTFEGNQKAILQSAGSMNDLLDKCLSTDVNVTYLAFQIVSNLASSQGNREKVGTEGKTLEVLAKYLRSPDPISVRYATSILSYLLQSQKVATKAITEQGQMVKDLEDLSIFKGASNNKNERRSRAYASHCIIYLSQHENVYTQLKKGILVVIYRSMLEANQVEIEEKAIAAKAILHHLLAEKRANPVSYFLPSDYDLLTSSLLTNNEPIIKHYVAAVINILVQQESVRKLDICSFWLAPLIQHLALASDPETQVQALSSMYHLSKEKGYRTDLACNPQHLHLFASLIRSNHELIELNTVNIFFNITCSEELRDVVGKDGDVITGLLAVTRRKDSPARKPAILSLFNLASFEDNKIRLVQSGATEPLLAMAAQECDPLVGSEFIISLVKSKNIEVMSTTITGIRNTASQKELATRFSLLPGVLESLISILDISQPSNEHRSSNNTIPTFNSSSNVIGDDFEVQWNSLRTLTRLADVADGIKVRIIDAGVLRHLQVLLNSSISNKDHSTKIRMETLALLSSLSAYYADDYKDLILDANILPPLVTILDLPNPEIQSKICNILVKLAENDRQRKRIMESKIFPPLKKAQSSTDEKTRRDATELALLLIGESSSAKSMAIEAGLQLPIIN